jgi:hypothetical protein
MSKSHHSLPRRRRNLLAADPHCFWCGREVQEYARPFAKGEPVPDDMATVDHLNQKQGNQQPRPERGATVLSCWPCNNARGAAGCARDKLPCVYCGVNLTHSQFCCGECHAAWTARMAAHLLPQAERRRAERIARKKARFRAKKKRWRERRRLHAAVASEPVVAVEAEPAS